jgi:S-(hydroxymethyl)glutathione dehydrogenase/alcohol dehydrogenase
VLGHEGAGIVEAVGIDVTQVKPGDHVTFPEPALRTVFHCERDPPILANHSPAISRRGCAGWKFQNEPWWRASPPLFGHLHACQYAVVRESAPLRYLRTFRLTGRIIGCGVMTVSAQPCARPGSRGINVAVIGCGAVG